jgi:hypothetical protein
VLVLYKIQGTFSEDADVLGKMDPYLTVTCHDQAHKTEVVKEGGKQVEWNSEIKLRLVKGMVISFAAYDEDAMSSDFLGMTVLKERALEGVAGKKKVIIFN